MPSIDEILSQHVERSRHLSALADDLLARMDEMPVHALRLELARLGWTSTVEVTSDGWGSFGYGLTVRLRRWDWHGRRTAGDPHFMMSLRACDLTPESGERIFRSTARRAVTGLRDFPDNIPRWDNGKLEADTLHDSLFSTPMEFYFRPEWPTEAIPGGCVGFADATFVDLLAPLEEAGRRGWDLSHELTHLFFNADNRSHDRVWGQRIELTVSGRFGGYDRIMPYYHRISSETLMASTCCRLLDGTLREVDALARMGSRLPGMLNIDEYRDSMRR